MGPLATHMALHIILMNALAPLTALILCRLSRKARFASFAGLLWSTIVQLLLLWGWHSPPLLNSALQSHWVHAVMQASLFVASFSFWWAVFSFEGERRWRPILALLVTSKLFCLLAVLFIFSPRMLYLGLGAVHPHEDGSVFEATLADQQLAGLLMLGACPVIYVLGGVLLARRWLIDIEDSDQGRVLAASTTRAGY
nr:cytochrome c oxidase assembly protein [Rhizobium sp. Q54]